MMEQWLYRTGLCKLPSRSRSDQNSRKKYVLPTSPYLMLALYSVTFG